MKELGNLKTVAANEQITTAISDNYTMEQLLKEISDYKDTRVIEAALRTPWLKTLNFLTRLLLHVIAISKSTTLEYLISSHSDEIDWKYTDPNDCSLFHLVLANAKLESLTKKLFQEKTNEVRPFINKVTKSNQTLLSMACIRQLLPVIKVLVDNGASLLIQDHDIWKLPAFTDTSIQLGVVVDRNNYAIIYVEFIKGKAICSFITNPEKAYMLDVKDLTPFNKLSNTEIKKMILIEILKFPSHLIALALGNQYPGEFDNSVLFMAVEHAHPVVLRDLLKIPRLSQTQQEITTRNNILHKAIQVNNLDNLEILMEEAESSAIDKNLSALNSANQTPIDLAIKIQHYGAITKIFNKKDLIDKLWLNLVDKAISSCDINLLKELMDYFSDEYKGKLMYEKTNNEGLSILHIAVKKFKSEEAFNIILSKYKSVITKPNLIDCKITSQSQVPNFKGQTPLLLSLTNKQYLATEKLLEAGAANLNEGEQCYFHYLIEFCQEKEELKKLLNIDLNSNQFSQCTKPSKVKIWEVTDVDSNTLLHYSVKCRDSIAIDLLGKITPFTDLLKPDSKGNSLLHTAATLFQHPIVIDCIINILKKHHRHAHYSDLLDLQNKHGCTPLMLAVHSNHLKFIESLLKDHASIRSVDHKGNAILHIAAELGKGDVFQCILDFVDQYIIEENDRLKFLHQRNSEGYSPIQCAVINGQIEIIKLYGKKHNLSSCDGEIRRSLLHLAVLNGPINLSVLKQLIDELLTDRSLLEIRDKDGRTPLMLAVINHKVNVTSILLQYQPDLLATDSQGLSLLHNAVSSYDKMTFAKVLNAIRFDKNSKQIVNFKETKQQRTVLHYSIEKNNEVATEEILKLGLSLKSEDIEGNTCLHVASKSPSTVIILKLIIEHAKTSSNNLSEMLEQPNENDFTPLHYAICNRNYEACKTLVNEKANLVYQAVDGLAFHETIGELPLTICEYHQSYHVGYHFPFASNLSWILSPLSNLRIIKHTLDRTIKVPKDLNDLLVQEIVSCKLIQPLRTLLQQVNFPSISHQRLKSSLFIPAAQFGSLPVIQFLIKNYFSPQVLIDLNNGNILYESINNPNFEIVKVLCDTVVEKNNFARIDKILSRKQECDFCALELCVKLSRLGTFQYFLQPEFCLSLEMKNPKGTTLFHFILENVQVSEQKQFLDALATAIQDRENKKPKSTYINNTPLVDCQIQDSGETPLHLCASKYPDCIGTILQLNPSPIKEDSSGNTALHLSVKSDNFNCTKEIVNAYKNSGIVEIINKTNKKKQTPLHIAVEIANLEIVQLLLHNNSKLYAVDDESSTVLHYAVQIKTISKSEKISQFLLKHEIENPEPNQSLSTYQDTKGYTPLHSAIACSNLKSMNVLLQYDFAFNTSDLDGNSILHLALLLGKSTTMVKSILDGYHKDTAVTIHDSNGDEFINLKNNQGKTALILAVEKNNVDTLNEILKYFPLLRLVDNDGNSCLHKAVENTNDLGCLGELLEIINKLYPDEMESYLSAINANGLSPLHHAIKNQNHKAAEKLCEYGANIAIQLQNKKITLCNGQELKFNIRVGPPPSTWRTLKNIVSDAKDYFVCYAIVDKGTTYHIASLLPDLETTAITTTNLKIITSATKRTLEMICSCHCIEPLIHAIEVKWIDFSKEETDKQWDVLCGNISKEVSDYLYTTYPDQMISPKMFKALENATKAQDEGKVKSFLEKHSNQGDLGLNKTTEKTNAKKTNENTLAQTIKNSLEYSIDNDNENILNIFLERKALFNHMYENNDTLLHMIIRKKKPVSFLTSILEKNKELQSNNSEQLIGGTPIINHRNNEGKTALHICIENGHDELLEKLLEYHPELTLTDVSFNNILHCVAKLGSNPIAEIIFDHLKSPFPNCFPEAFFERNKDGCTPLHLAAEFGNESIFSKLLEKGADLSATDSLEQTTLHYSLKNKNEDNRLAILNFILNPNNEIKADFVKCQNTNGFSALQIAVKFQYEKETYLLLQANPATMYLEDKDTRSNSLHLAVSTKNVNIFDKILSCLNEEANASNDPSSFEYTIVCKRNIDGKTPVHLSIESKNLYALEKLLSLSKPCLEISDNDQDTLLHYAVKVSRDSCEYLNAVLKAFKSCYSENIQTRLYPCNLDGFPPLQYAIEFNRYQAATVLIENSVQLPYLNGEGICLLSNPKNNIPLRIYYEKQQSPNNLKYWIGYQIKFNVSSNWIVVCLPDLSKTTYFDISKPIQEVSKLDIKLLLAILQCHSTDPFKSAVNSKLITQHQRLDGSSLLKYVGQYSTREVIAYFIDWYKCVIFESTKEHSSLIEYTVANSDQLVLRFLLEKLLPIVDQSLSPLQPNATKEVNEQYKIALCLKSALRLSLNNDNVEALELLLEFNAKHDHTYDGLNTLLHLMVIQRKPCEFIKSLLTRNRKVEKLPADPGTIRFIDAHNAQKETSLHLALQTKQENTIKEILSFGPEIVTKDSKGNTPLHLAILLNNYDIIETVLNLSKHDPKIVNAVNKQKCTPLHLSVDNGDYRVTELLLTSKADIYCRDNDEKTILHHAIEIVDSERRSLVFNELIKFEDKTFGSHKLCTTQDKQGNTPLNLAITKSDNGIVTSLLEYPSVLEVTNKQGETPLHLAVINNDENTMESILDAIKKTENISDKNIPKKDSIINSQDSTGCTPLHLSIQQKNTDALTKLLAVNPYLDIFNDDGDQPLHLAVLSKENDILTCVLDSILKLEKGCIGYLEQRLTCMKQRNGKTPLHLSIENNNTHALHSLLQTKPCLDVCDTNGDTVVHCAAKNSSDNSTCLEIVLKELEKRFSEDYSYHTYMLNSRKLTPLHYAIKFSKLNCIKMLLEHQVNLAFLDPCGDKTLLDGIDSFSLSFVKHKGEYWIGYKFTKARKPNWILTKLPNLNLTEIVERDLPTTKNSDFELLKLISQSESTEPLDAALRNKLLNVDTSLNHEHMNQVIARHGTKQSLRCLLSKTKSGLFHRSDGKLSMIECAVSNPNIDALEYLLHSLPAFQQQPGGIGSESPSEESTQICSCLKNSLLLSISNESSKALISLLRFYPKIDCTYTDDNTLIHQMIIDNKSSQFIKEVLEVIREIQRSNSVYKDKQIINHCNFEKKTALHCCIERKQLSTLEVLLQFNPDAFVVDENEETSLHYAVNSNELEFVEAIYRHAPCVELLSAKNNVADTALHLAVKNANDGIVEFILKCNPPFDSQNSHGSTVLHLAVVIGNSTKRELIMEQLISHNANKILNVTRIQDCELKSPLHLAVSKQYPDAVDSLLSADPRALHIRDNKGQTPLHLTIIPSLPCSTTTTGSSGEKEWVEPALDNTIFDGVLKVIEKQGKHDETQSYNGIHLLCMQDERKRTALHYAIEHHYSYAFTELLKTGSCLDISDDIGNTLVHEGVRKNSDVKFLKELVAELERRFPESWRDFL